MYGKFEDLLIESGTYGSGTASSLLKGKSYNRGVRGHKLLLETMTRLQLQSFSKWIDDNTNDPVIATKKKSCILLLIM